MTTINSHTTRAAGTILTATIYNTDHVNHVLNAQNLNAGKIEKATAPVVDGEAVFFSGTGAATVKASGAKLRLDGDNIIVVSTVGADSVIAESTIRPNFQILGGNLAAHSQVFGAYRADTGGPLSYFCKSRNATVGSHTIVASGDSLGEIHFNGSDGVAFQQAATIRCAVNGTPGVGDMPGRLSFLTTPDGTATPVERMRIDNGGHVIIGDSSGGAITGLFSEIPSVQAVGTSGDSQIGSFRFSADGNGGSIELLKSRSATIGSHTIVQNNDSFGIISWGGSDGSVYREGCRIRGFCNGTPGASDMPGGLALATTADGAVTPTDTIVLFAAGAVTFPRVTTTASAANAFLDSGNSNNLLRSTSSIRYKRDIEDIDSERIRAVMSLRPVRYRSKSDNDRADWSWYGLIAEEVAEIDPRLVHWSPDEDDELVPESVMYDRVAVLLLGIVKEQEARIAKLEAALGKK